MRRILGWLIRGLALVAVLLAAAAGGGYLWLRTSLPVLDGSIALAGPSAPIEIVRDRHAIPHIFAQSRADAAFALGYVHAQDRLWQLEFSRRVGAGRLAEILGADALPIDRFLRTLGVYRVAEANYRNLDATSRAVLDAYAAGINAYLEGIDGPLPPEFLILRHRPEPWRPADSLVWLKMMAWDLSANWASELLRLRLARRLSRDKVERLFPRYRRREPRGVGDLRAAFRALPEDGLRRLAALSRSELFAGSAGSNSWVLAGARTATGRPLLANDPHLGLRAPSTWYLAHLSWPGHDVIGGTLPSLPFVIIGRNARIAWGLTTTGSDVQDLYLEKLDPARPDHYVTPEGPKPFVTRREVIEVKGADALEITVRETRHGPVISDVHGGAGEALAEGQVLALSWTALRADDATARAGVRIAEAGDAAAFRAALRDFHAPQQNVVFADIEGAIGFHAAGRVPLRVEGFDHEGFWPAAGWDGDGEWRGFVAFDRLPRANTPAGGAIVTANHQVVDDDYPFLLTFEWADGYRARRIDDLLRARERHSIESFMTMQADTLSLMAVEMLPHLLAVKSDNPKAAALIERVRDWDGRMAGDRPEPLIFHAWYRELTRLIYGDELGDLFAGAWRPRPRFVATVLGGDREWCDDISTPATETCAAIAAQALELADAWLRQRHGEDPARWRWDEEHIAHSRHQPFSQVDLLRELFDIRLPVPGDAYTINVGRTRLADPARPFDSVHGPGLRMIADLDDPDRSLFIHSTGQSGNPLSPHYADLAPLWQAVRYVPMTTDRADIAAGAIGTLRLVPAR